MITEYQTAKENDHESHLDADEEKSRHIQL